MVDPYPWEGEDPCSCDCDCPYSAVDEGICAACLMGAHYDPEFEG